MRRWLLALLLLGAVGLAHAEGDQHTLTTTVGAPLFLGITYEYDLIPDPFVEITVGGYLEGKVVDGALFPSFELAPYIVLGYYPDTVSVWLELNLPEDVFPGFGRGDHWVALSTQYRW